MERTLTMPATSCAIAGLGVTDVGKVYGATVGAMIEYASLAIASGNVSVVACVFADAPLRPDTTGGTAWSEYTTRGARRGLPGLRAAIGFSSPTAHYALA